MNVFDFIDASPQVHFSRFKHGVVPLSHVTTDDSPGFFCAHELLTRASHQMVKPLRKHCDGVIKRQPTRSPWYLSSQHSHKHVVRMTTVVMKLSYRQVKFTSLTWMAWRTGLPHHVHSDSLLPRSKLVSTLLVAKRVVPNSIAPSSGFDAPLDDKVSQSKCLSVFLSTKRSGCCEDSRCW